MVGKGACVEVCVQYTWTQFSLLPVYYFTWFFFLWGSAIGRPATWETNDSEHQQLLNNLFTPTHSHFFSIPRYQQSQLTHTNAQWMERQIVFLANRLYHLFNICWVFLVLFCFRVGVGVDVTLQTEYSNCFASSMFYAKTDI